ncbi:heavy metal translocating P-type ATPase [Brevifollis gellanilyticus]|uniref:Heavy metal-(Cd/Co/Hg/Pb/Zn)-translocating P-type ATPase n=1 Tax=Brevifollis gellanilyticus TaxID=748831 RepID=A0A512MF81_9BACT|nr:cation-translocating P-type ATPase [Brevifollis gellanilyticus]GEP45407.1 heavy metal-(Cd/Co/Hg/Pb/Zn)-translocating P-type ATPase [Brevifollis gellanilyticus]
MANEADISWTQALADFIASQTAVEAVRLDTEGRRVEVATLGPVDETLLQQRLNEVLRLLDENLPASGSLHSLQITRGGHSVLMQKPTCITAPRFWQWREFEWPEAEEIERQSDEEWRKLAVQAAVCGLALAAGWAADRRLHAPPWLTYSLFGISMISGGLDAAGDAWEKLRQKQLDVHFLMLAVAAGATAVGAWQEGALLLLLFSTSGALEHYVLHRTHREISALTKAAPKHAHLMQPDGSVEDRPVSQLRAGDVIQVRPAELFPVDGTVILGDTAADESTLTGESVPVDKGKDAQVFGGTLNLWGLVQVRTDRPATQSALARIISLIQTAQRMRAPSQRFTDRFGTRYTLLTLGTVLVMFLVWWLALGARPFTDGESGRSAFYRAMTLLVVMSPCALVLSIPSAILAAIAWGARRGILFRGGAAIEKLAEVDTVAMDKTGTLTEGNLRVARVESFPAGKETTVLQLAVTLDAHSNHPIARAITQHAKSLGIQPGELLEFQSIPGQGLRGRTSDGVTYAGRRELMSQGDFSRWLSHVPDAPPGFSEVWVLSPSTMGRVLLTDEIREGSHAVLKALSAEKLRTVMLTGDRRAAAIQVAQKLGVADVRAGLHPEDKVAAIQELTREGHRVAMVGDGVNDAPCLAAAHVSIAMGARGSDAAMEQADIVLMQDRIEKLLSARHISACAKAVIQQNLAISLGSVIIMAVAAVLGVVPLTLGVLTHEGSTVIVCLNSLRLLFVKEPALTAPAASPDD